MVLVFSTPLNQYRKNRVEALLQRRWLQASFMSPKNVTNVVRYILVQLSSLQASGRWPLAAGLLSLPACLWVGQQQEA